MQNLRPLFALPLIALFYFSQAQTFDLYVSDAGNFDLPPWQILKFDENGENPEVFISSNLAWPQDILFLEDEGVVLISNLNSGRINKHDAETGEFIEIFASGIGGPTRMKVGEDGNLYVLQWSGNGLVLRYELDGTALGAFTDEPVPQSIGLDWDRERNLYVSSYTGDLVRKFDAEGKDMGIFVNSNLQGPTNIWFDADGDLLISDYNSTAVKRYDQDGDFVNNFILGLSQSEGVAFYPDGRILIGNGATDAVKLFDSEGNFIEDFVASGAGDLLQPNAVVLRERSSGVEDGRYRQVDFIRPGIGREFYLPSELVDEYNSVDVYNAQGILIKSRAIEGQSLWDASQSPEGIYILVVRHKDGAQFSQKVVVKG